MTHPKIYPVIHHIDHQTTVAQAGKAVLAGADGVFLISHHGADMELIGLGGTIQKNHPGFSVGMNMLSTDPIEAVSLAHLFGFPMLWGDDMGVDSSGLNPMGKAIQAQAHVQGFKTEIFASVAFKYRPHEPDPALAARLALEAGFIPTTSGPGTGSAPELEKIISMSTATKGVLAVASGMTPENVSQFAPYLSHILVSTGISINDHEMDDEKLRLLIANSRRNPIATLQQHHNGDKRVVYPGTMTDGDIGWRFKQTALFTQEEVQAAIEECHQLMSVTLWTVYDHPTDFPDGFIARRWQASSYRTEATTDVVVGPTLESVRSKLPKGLHNIGRQHGDDPKIAECWI